MLLNGSNGLKKKEERLIAYTEIDENIEVVTIFLGVNHRFLPDNGRPVLFEAMVIGGDLDEKIDRYTTYDKAKNGHKAMVEHVKSQIGLTAENAK